MNWDFIEGWGAPSSRAPRASWAAVEAWSDAAKQGADEVERELAELVNDWIMWLEPLGEISAQDWRRFRPLRLEREEAWTDWLAHLLAQSRSGSFACTLLQKHPRLAPVTNYALLDVAREVRSADGERRADIIIVWPKAVAHVEVKVGDRCFEKTFETGELLEKGYGKGRSWADFILLPSSDVEEWREGALRSHNGRFIHEITWHDVAVALRRTLRGGDESLHWRTWAHSFCGAIEQRLLGCEPEAVRVSTASAVRRLALGLAQLAIMKKGAQ